MIDKSVDALTLAAGTKGYAFVDIRPRVRRNKDDRPSTSSSRSKKARASTSNASTSSATPARSTKSSAAKSGLVEGDAFNRVLINRSRSRIRGLGFFKKVEINGRAGRVGRPHRSERRSRRTIDRRILGQRGLLVRRQHRRRRQPDGKELARPRSVPAPASLDLEHPSTSRPALHGAVLPRPQHVGRFRPLQHALDVTTS